MGHSFDTSYGDHFITAQGFIEISSSPALVSTTRPLHFLQLRDY